MICIIMHGSHYNANIPIINIAIYRHMDFLVQQKQSAKTKLSFQMAQLMITEEKKKLLWSPAV